MQKAKVLCIVVSFENSTKIVQGFHMAEQNRVHVLTEFSFELHF